MSTSLLNNTFSAADLSQICINNTVLALIFQQTPQTAIDTVTLVDKLVQSLPRVRWAEPIHSEARWLLDECIWYVVSHFLQIITEPKFDMLLVVSCFLVILFHIMGSF